MISEITSNNSNTVWDNYDVATKTLNDRITLISISLLATVGTLLGYAWSISPVFWGTAPFYKFFVLSALSLSTIAVAGLTARNPSSLEDKRVIALILTMGLTLIVAYKFFGLLAIFTAMCVHTLDIPMELTREKYMELIIGNVKKNIASDEPKEDWLMLPNKLKDYCHIHFKFGHHYPFSVKDMSEVLNFAYSYKKILTFPGYWFGHWPYFTQSARQEIQKKRFELSVEYLINCKKNCPNLDEDFVNEQLLYLVFITHDTSWNLFISNGIPLILEKETLGDITELKQKLKDAFGEVTEIR